MIYALLAVVAFLALLFMGWVISQDGIWQIVSYVEEGFSCLLRAILGLLIIAGLVFIGIVLLSGQLTA